MGRADIVDSTLGTIYGIELMLGAGIPDPGDLLINSAGQFLSIAEKIGTAIPGTNWIGEAASAYLNQNALQKIRSETMATIDNATGNVISKQAGYIEHARNVLGVVKKCLKIARPVAVALTYIPFVGWGLSFTFQLATCGVGMAAVGIALLVLTIQTAMNVANVVRQLTDLGSLISALPTLAGIIPDIIGGLIPNLPGLIPGLPDLGKLIPGLPSLPGGLIPGLPAIPGLPSLPDFLFPDIGKILPNVPGLADLPFFNGKFPDIPFLPGLTGGIPGLGDIAGFFPELPFGDLFSGLGNFGGLADVVPNMGQLGATVGQLGQLSGQFGPASQLAGQIQGQVQQIAQAGQQSQQEGAPEDGLAGDAATEGAAAAAGDGGRAPVDALTLTSDRRQEEPGRGGERLL